MEVILLERVEKLGEMGDVVNVKPGFARNYLLPQSKALRATPQNRESFESRRAELEAANAERRSSAEKVADGIAGASVVLVRQASDAGQLYGSVRPRDIANALNEQGAEVDRTQVKLDAPIKVIGLHTVRIAVHPEVVVEITANVARSEDEAELQAQGKSLVDEDVAEEEDVGYEEALEAEEEQEAAQEDDAEASDAPGGETEAESESEQGQPEDQPRAT
ncbi:MAG TPA: 50S ribosomal protein L9 [Alphaproteobacteria bacterium]|nr:50S ribosomal protein L9 [Alphaproteobacteria bacterium]